MLRLLVFEQSMFCLQIISQFYTFAFFTEIGEISTCFPYFSEPMQILYIFTNLCNIQYYLLLAFRVDF